MATSDPPPVLEPAGRPRRGKRLLIAAGIVLACSFLPWTCNASYGSHHYSWDHAGPLICGAIAALLALIALARGGHVIAGLVLAALGAAAVVYGFATVEPTGSPSDPAALARDATDRVFAALGDGKPDAIAALADAELPLPAAHRFAGAITRRFGRWQSTGGVHMTVGDDGVAADGTSYYERGSVTFRLVFRVRDGAARLAGLDLHIPDDERPTDAAGAEAAARALAADLAAGDLDRVTADLDPRIDPAPSFPDDLRRLHQAAGAAPQILLDAKSACGGDQQCFDLVIQTAVGPVRLHVVEEPTYGQWLATSYKLGTH